MEKKSTIWLFVSIILGICIFLFFILTIIVGVNSRVSSSRNYDPVVEEAEKDVTVVEQDVYLTNVPLENFSASYDMGSAQN